MHLIVGRLHLENIKRYIKTVSEVLKSENILIKTTKDKLIFFSCSSSCFIRKEFNADEKLVIKECGQVFVNFRTFNDLINKIDPKKELEIYNANKNYLQLFSGSSYECDLVLFNCEEINDLNFFDEIEGNPIKFPIFILSQCNNRMKYFCRKIDNSISDNSVLMNIHFRKDSDISFVEAYSSDSYRFVYGEFELQHDGEFQINVSPFILSAILNVYKNEQYVNFYLIDDENYLICGNKECTIKVKLNTSNYPSFLHWFNIEETVSFSVKKENLMNMIDRNLLFLSTHDIHSTLYKVEEDKLIVSYNNNEKGKCREVLDIKNDKNVNVEFYLNNLLLRDLIKFIDSDEIIFKVHDSLKPVILLPLSGDSHFKQFILPIRNFKQ